MELVNTSDYNTEEVTRLVKFACEGLNMDGVKVEVKDPRKANKYHGLAHLHSMGCRIEIFMHSAHEFPLDNLHIHQVPYKIKPGETIWVNGEKKTSGTIYKQERRPYGTEQSPYISYGDWREFLVAIMSHEARHCYFFKNNRTFLSKDEEETACEKFSLMRLTYYREERK